MSRHQQPSWMIPHMPAIESVNSGGILVAVDLVQAIKESYLVRLRSECIVVVASYGLSSEINERGHDSRYAYHQTSSAVKTRTSPVIARRRDKINYFSEKYEILNQYSNRGSRIFGSSLASKVTNSFFLKASLRRNTLAEEFR